MWSAGGLVGLRGVEGEGSEELPGGRVDDPDVEVLDEQDDGGSGGERGQVGHSWTTSAGGPSRGSGADRTGDAGAGLAAEPLASSS